MLNNLSGPVDPSATTTTPKTDATSGLNSATTTAPPASQPAMTNLAKASATIDGYNKPTVVTQTLENPKTTENPLYPATATPTLARPDPESHAAPQPFDPSWRRATNQFFINTFREDLIKQIKEKNPNLSAEEVEAKALYLNQIISVNQTDTLSSKDKDTIKLSLITATETTQKAWSLPPAWNVKSQSIEEWTPTVMNPTPPVNMEIAQREVIGENTQELLTSIENAAMKVKNQFPSNESARLAIGDLVAIISAALRDLKAVLQLVQMNDANISSKVSVAKGKDIGEMIKITDQNIQQMFDAQKAREEQAKLAAFMKIFAPIMSGALTVIGMLALPFTAGASLALVAAGVAVGMVMLTYTVLDAVFDLTTKAVEAFNKYLEDKYPDPPASNIQKRNMIKGAVLGALVVVLVVALLASGGGALGTVAATTAGEIAKQAAQLAIKQLTIQFAMMAIMSSNLIPDLIIQSLIANGAIDKDDEKTKMIVTMIIMAVTMVVMVAGVSKYSMKGPGIKEGITGAVSGVGNAIKSTIEAISNIGKTITKLIDAIKSAAVTSIQQMIKALERMLNSLMAGLASLKDTLINIPSNVKGAIDRTVAAAKNMLNYLSKTSSAQMLSDLWGKLKTASTELIELLGQELKNLGKSVYEFLTDFINGHLLLDPRKLVSTNLDEIAKKRETYMNVATFFKTTGQLTSTVVEMTTGIMAYQIGNRLGKLLEEMGETEKSLQTINNLIKLMDKLLSSLQEDMSKNSDFLKSLGNAMDNLFSTAAQDRSRIMQG